MNFIKWLGVSVPAATEERILSAGRDEKDHASRVDASVHILCEVLRNILEGTAGCGVPMGVSCESVSIYKSEIDGVHELFRKLQSILLDTRGSPWKVSWFYLPHNLEATAFDRSQGEASGLGREVKALSQSPPLSPWKAPFYPSSLALAAGAQKSGAKRLAPEDFLHLVEAGVYTLEDLIAGDWWTPIKVSLEAELKQRARSDKKQRLTATYDALLLKQDAGTITPEELKNLAFMEALC
jgi:hypothetical protein